MRRHSLVIAALILVLITVGCSQAGPTATRPPPVSTAPPPPVTPMPTPLPPGVELTAGELSVRGRRVYSRSCAICHEEPFAGDLANALHRFPHASAMLGYMRATMPQDNPGSLELDDYLAVLAKVLVENGVLAEDSILDPNALAEIIFD